MSRAAIRVSILAFAGLVVAALASLADQASTPGEAAPCCLTVTSPTFVGFTASVSYGVQDDLAGTSSAVTVTGSGPGRFFSGGIFTRIQDAFSNDCAPTGVGSNQLTYSADCINDIDDPAPNDPGPEETIDSHFTSAAWLCTSPGQVTFSITQGGATMTTTMQCIPSPAPGGSAAPARVAVRLSVPAQAVECGASVFVLVMVTDGVGNPVPDGTPVNLLTNFGTLNPTSTTTLSGAANVVYTAPPGDTREVVVTAAAGAAFGVVEFRVTCPTPTPSPTPAPTATPSPTTVAPVAGAGTPGAPSAAAATGTAQAAGAAAGTGTGTGTGVGVGLGTGAPAGIRPPSTGDGGLAAPRPGPAAAIAIALAAVLIAPILRRRLS